MKLHFSTRYVLLGVALAVALTLTLGATGTAAAQSVANETITVQTGGAAGEECTERITEDLAICDASFSGGTATVVFESERAQRLTLTDAGAFVAGGEIFRDSATVFEGRNTVRVPATQVSGYAGVAIDTGDTLYAKKITEVSSSGPAISYQNVQMLIGITAIGAAAFTFRTVRKRRDDESKDWEKIL
jgi:hypothetical protein